MCPSSASSAIADTVSATPSRFNHAPCPNALTARNPTTTRSSVTLFGVQTIHTCRDQSPQPYPLQKPVHSAARQPPLFQHPATRPSPTPPPPATHTPHFSL